MIVVYSKCILANFCLHCIKADLLAQYGGVAPKMAEGAHMQVIDQVQSHMVGPF